MNEMHRVSLRGNTSGIVLQVGERHEPLLCHAAAGGCQRRGLEARGPDPGFMAENGRAWGGVLYVDRRLTFCPPRVPLPVRFDIADPLLI